MDKGYQQILENNKQWSDNILREDPDFFKNLVDIQTPEYLWIGCSDSRVPADMVTGTKPGQIFVHRNVANLVVNTDINMLSVLQYAVEVLKVKHVIVCGHYGCGGVKAAMGNQHYGIINHWLKEIKDIYRHKRNEIDSIQNESERLNALIELNVKEQVFNLAKTHIVQKAWRSGQSLKLHGWVYSLSNGLINQICDMDHETPMDSLYQYGEV